MTGSPRYCGFAFLVPRTGRPGGSAAVGGGAVGATASSAIGSSAAVDGSAAGVVVASLGGSCMVAGGGTSGATASSSLSLPSPPPDGTTGLDGVGATGCRTGGRTQVGSSNTTVCDCVTRPSSNNTRCTLDTSGPSKPRKRRGTPRGSSLCRCVCGLPGLCTQTLQPNRRNIDSVSSRCKKPPCGVQPTCAPFAGVAL
jgi:hypothetical protein